MTGELGRLVALEIARQFRDGDLDLNDAVDRLPCPSRSFMDRTRLLGELVDEINLEDIPAVSS